MSLWRDSGRFRWPEAIEKWPFFVGLGCILVAIFGGLLVYGGGGHDGGDSAPPPVPQRTATASPTPTASPSKGTGGLKVTSWGHSSGQLAVVVRNDSKRVISRERVLIVGRDANGVAVLTSTGTPKDVCCTVIGVRPGHRFALFTEVGAVASNIKDVTVRPIAGSVRLGKAAKTPKVEVADVRLRHLSDDTVVEATLTATGKLSGYVAAQALLVDDRGRVVQVVSGRFYCFGSGKARRVRLHLFHAVPRSLEVGKVLAQSIPAGVPPGVPGRCGKR